MKKKILVLAILLLGMCILTGCQCTHEWTEANCTTAKTCSKCEETEGEPLGHTWEEVTCAAPKTCITCGETEGEALAHTWEEATCAAPKTCITCGENEGEALAHTWVEANYQDPKTCSVCSETEGEPLKAYFEEHKLSINVQADKETTYVTTCNNRRPEKTKAKLLVSNYRIFESDETHAAKEGYEWRAIDVTVTFSDQNAYLYGWGWSFIAADYYTKEPNYHEDISSMKDTFTVNYHGINYDCMVSYENIRNDKWVNRSIQSHAQIYVQIPIGYDGTVVAFFDHTIDANGRYIHDAMNSNARFFRFDNSVQPTQKTETEEQPQEEEDSNSATYDITRDTSEEHIPALSQRLAGNWKSFQLVQNAEVQSYCPPSSLVFGENNSVTWTTSDGTYDGTWEFKSYNTQTFKNTGTTMITYQFAVVLDDSTTYLCNLYNDFDQIDFLGMHGGNDITRFSK